MKKNKRGSLLTSLLILIGTSMIVLSSFTTQSVLSSRLVQLRYRSSQAYQIADSLISDTVQKYMRFGTPMTNLYQNWTSGCLQNDQWLCKMELSLSQEGGTIDAWGQYNGQIRHLQATLSVDAQGRISIDKIEEISN